jgi:hypothetical protein
MNNEVKDVSEIENFLEIVKMIYHILFLNINIKFSLKMDLLIKKKEILKNNIKQKLL